MRRGSICAGVFLRLNQQGGQSLRAGRRRRAHRPPAAGDQPHYLMALTGGFRRRISARQFRSRVYSAMSARSRRSPPPPAARRWRVPHARGRPREEERPLGQCEPGAASRRPGARGTAAGPPTRFSPSTTPAPRSADACGLLCVGSHHILDQRGRWKMGAIASKSKFATLPSLDNFWVH